MAMVCVSCKVAGQDSTNMYSRGQCYMYHTLTHLLTDVVYCMSHILPSFKSANSLYKPNLDLQFGLKRCLRLWNYQCTVSPKCIDPSTTSLPKAEKGNGPQTDKRSNSEHINRKHMNSSYVSGGDDDDINIH
ncbi:hypothetical protein Pmani_016335 [Petrolisthes manimaculis]|uniref:Uncharacterized protein n=1 Tax=Petrolisthes manimaculis TaxID=1843537 RepID=A0AAE1PPB0_9EUCA|nr:hypothetical protein Pmani_016335 [Petrolisthes manimaculis]